MIRRRLAELGWLLLASSTVALGMALGLAVAVTLIAHYV